MKKIFGFFMAFVLLITLLPGQQTEAAAVNKHYTVKVTKLEVREKPSPKSKTVGSLKKEAVVFVYNTEPGGWAKIKYNNKAGYIASSGLKGQASSSNPTPANKKTPMLMKDIKFGMSPQQVKNRETRTKYLEKYNAGSLFIGYYATKYNRNTKLIYDFQQNKLNLIWHDFNPDDKYFTTEELYYIYYDLLAQMEKEFGNVSIHEASESPYYIDASSFWQLKDYDVLLRVKDVDGEIDMDISYHPKTYGAALQEVQDKRLNHFIENLENYKKKIKE